MSNYTKERNILTIHLDGKSGDYRLDLSTGILYGLRGSAIKRFPERENLCRMFNNARNTSRDNIARVIYGIVDNYTNTYVLVTRLQAIMGAEKMDAIGFKPRCSMTLNDYSYINENFSDFSKFLRERYVDCDVEREFRTSHFNEYIREKNFRKRYGNLFENVNHDIIRNLYGLDLTREEMSVALYYLVKQKVWEYEDSVYKVTNYLMRCRAMGKTPEKTAGFTREYVETMREYEARKAEYDEKRLVANYAVRKEAFTFTFGEYSVFVPTKSQDIIDEGRNMHHCVGSYVSRVVEGDCYIVFIRKTATPDDCYLTCQVYNSGEIGQYYLAYDRRISSQEDIAFYEAFQAHLRSVWDK